ncbi:uncharacterized protein LOC127777595 [Oryza glaberrima]|uniref:uncharacterized protein LOC127777595 n=1 Tax=Oryza glaberrima TaxID=4538 RepID=UPI00224BF963|nr:uncharacterized protein LOC127777595 [Oryza glaberrima]
MPTVKAARLPGSQGMTTRARAQRRSVAESGRLEKRARADPAFGPQEWRDWPNLFPDLVLEISGRLLSLDVAEYLRFRAVCKPWRDLTDDPRASGALDSRFRPRDWMVLAITPEAGPRRRLLNLATAASIGVYLPALSAHCYMCSTDGLLVLFDRTTRAIRLLDPLTGVLTDFPAFTISNVIAAVPPVKPEYISAVFRNLPWGGTNPNAIDGAGIDDSTSPPTLLLCLRNSLSNIIFAKPGDEHWTLVSQGDAFFPQYEREGKVHYHSLQSFQGHCYVTTPEGSVYVVQLSPMPRLAKIILEQYDVCPYRYRHLSFVRSFLATFGDCHGHHGGHQRMLMVRYWVNIENFGGRAAYKRTQLHTVRDFAGPVTGRIEVLEVDIARRRLVPMSGLGCHAVFLGTTHCVVVSTKMFPSIAADAVYLSYMMQFHHNFSIYHINNRRSRSGSLMTYVDSGKKTRTEPPYKFDMNEDGKAVPCAQPCNVDEYLICYVDRKHMLSGPCINHPKHDKL